MPCSIFTHILCVCYNLCLVREGKLKSNLPRHAPNAPLSLTHSPSSFLYLSLSVNLANEMQLISAALDSSCPLTRLLKLFLGTVANIGCKLNNNDSFSRHVLQAHTHRSTHTYRQWHAHAVGTLTRWVNYYWASRRRRSVCSASASAAAAALATNRGNTFLAGEQLLHGARGSDCLHFTCFAVQQGKQKQNSKITTTREGEGVEGVEDGARDLVKPRTICLLIMGVTA